MEYVKINKETLEWISKNLVGRTESVEDWNWGWFLSWNCWKKNNSRKHWEGNQNCSKEKYLQYYKIKMGDFISLPFAMCI